MIRGDAVMEPGGLPEKLHFGSDYIYATDRSFALTSDSGHPIPRSRRADFPTFGVLPS